MANLETLELRINANAESASEGLRGLIKTLSSLSEALIKPYSDLRDFNAELQTMKKLGKIKVDIQSSQTTKDVKKATRAIEEQTDAIKEQAKVAETVSAKVNKSNGDLYSWKGGSSKRYNPSTGQWEKSEFSAKSAYYPIGKAEPAQDVKNMIEHMKRIGTYSEPIGKAADYLGKIKENASNSISPLEKFKTGIGKFTSGLFKGFSRIKRIATTMLIRKALRGLVAGLKEGMTNLYSWAKATNNAFGASMDSAKSKILVLKNSLGAALAPVVQALIPLFNSLASAIINVANWINQFISLISGKTSWTKAVETAADGTDALGDSAQGAGGKMKELLASFDELNVIASESGGGGHGITDNTEDYSNMFVEISKFDEKLRSIAEFVKNNLESIKDIAIAAGAAILAWKLSNVFADSLKVLSQVLGSLAIGADIAITLQLTWMLDNQFLDTKEDGWLYASILTTAVGATVAWALAKKLFSGKTAAYVAAITLTLSAVTDIVANVQHTNVDALSAESLKLDLVSALKAGAAAGIILSTATSLAFPYVLLAAGGVALLTFGVSLALKLLTQKDDIEVDESLIHLSQEQLDNFVRYRMFTIDPKVMVNVTEESIQNLTIEQEKIESKLLGMIGTLNVVRLGIAEDSDYATLKAQITGEGGLIDTVSGWINEANNVNKLVLKFTPQIVGSSSDDQQSWYLEATDGWKFVEKHMKELGKELADSIVEGEKGELQVKRPERVAAILEEIARISEIIAGSDVATEAQINLGITLNDLDPTSVSEAIAEYGKYKEQIAAAAKELQDTAYANQQRLVNALTAMLEIDPDNEEIKNKLTEAQAGLDQIKQEMKDGLDDAINEMLEPGRNMLQDWLDMNFDPGSISVDWSGKLRNILNKDGGFENGLKEILRQNHIDVDVNDFLEVGGWNLLSEDLQRKILANIVMTPATAALLKNSIGLDASAIFYYTNWDELSNKQKWALLNSLADAYGASDVIEAAKEAGIDLAQFISDGMQSGTPLVKEQAEKWNEILANYMKPEVKPTVNTSNVATQAQNANNVFLNKFPLKKKITVTGDASSAKKAGKTINDNMKLTTKKTVSVEASKASLNKIKADVDKQFTGTKTVNVNANVTGGFVDEFTRKVKEGFTRTFAGAKLKFDLVTGKVSFNATGGIVNSGDIFVANENGKSEMIGRFGNQTGVANQEQMVEAMARGVQYAQSEQNALLREQNTLLRGILQKEGTVRIGASSALGRVAKQSLEMYGNMVGG